MSRRGKIGDYTRSRLQKIIDTSIISIDSGRDSAGNPAGSDNQLQFNNGGSFGGIPAFTWDDTDLKVADNTKIKFGTNNDAYVEYNEDGDGFLIISGSSNGIVLSGSTVQIRGTLQGASPLKIAGGIEIVPTNDETDVSAMSFGDDIKLNFGDDNDGFIQYSADVSSTALEISGSVSAGVKILGPSVYIDKKMGIGVSGNNITHAITLPDNADTTGKIKANAYLTYSSEKLKENIKAIDNPLSIISNLRGVTFDWKKNKEKDYGFIAEEVGMQLPDIVEWDTNSTQQNPQALSMDYTRIIPILLEGIKMQQQQIDSLKSEINSLKRGC
tara:strand:+ start:105 stop:1088 length:984 start_codon:yes stop_codon:yes gene_type:complete